MRSWLGFLPEFRPAGLCLLALLLLLLPAPAWSLAAAPSDPQAPAYLGFFPTAQPEGQVPVTLVPHPRAVDRVVRVSFGVPFPPGYVRDPALISLLDNTGQELPIRVTVLARWLPPVPGSPSLRAVLIQYRDLMGSRVPRIYTLRWGRPRRQTMTETWPVGTGWFPVTDGSYPPVLVKDPPVWAMLPAKWLCQSLVKGRLAPAGRYKNYRWLATARAGYFQQAINKPILNKRQAAQPDAKRRYGVNYLQQYEPWLFDRTTTIFLEYMTTGKLEPLVYALRDVQYYAAKVQPDGNFALLKPGRPPNVIYGNQEALTLGWFFSGLPELKQASARVVKLLKAWNPDYSPERSFWTERHLAFHLMIATAAYEMTGNPALLKEARRTFEIGFHMQIAPPPGAPDDGCLIHTGRQHSGPLKGWICSPWMSVLFVDAALRYYLVSADPRVPRSILLLANYMVKTGTYRSRPRNAKRTYLFPYYLASSVEQTGKYTSTDWMHCLDTSKIMAAGIYFADKEGLPDQNYRRVYNELLIAAREMFPKHRQGRVTPYTLNPRRKFNWWFRTTGDIAWLVNQR